MGRSLWWALIMIAGCLQAGTAPVRYTALLGESAVIGGVAVDTNGSLYVTGFAAYGPLAATPAAFDTTYRPATCLHSSACPVGFAAKLTADGSRLVYLTYLGSSFSEGTGISVDSQGNAWIAGFAGGTDLPVTPGALQAAPKGNPSLVSNGFVMKLNAAGTRVLYCSWFGGSNDEWVVRVQAIDAAGNLYLGGETQSTDFPVTSAAFQTDAGAAPADAGFVAKFDAGGELVYSTYLHGASGSQTAVTAIAADAAGNAYVTGKHAGGSLPVTAGAWQTSAAESATTAAFAAKLDAAGATLVYATYLAGNSPAIGTGIAVDGAGEAYVAGNVETSVPGVSQLPKQGFDFTTTAGAFQSVAPPLTIWGINSAGFIVKLNAAGSAPVFSTYVGASGTTQITAIAVKDEAGRVVAVGSTWALDFPTTAGALFQCNPSGMEGTAAGSPSFLFELSADGSQEVYGTYVGQSAGLAIDAMGEVYLGGSLGPLPVVAGSFGWTGGTNQGAVTALAMEALPAGSVSCVVSAASRGGTAGAVGPAAIAPGEIVDIIGNGIGPPIEVGAEIVAGQLPVELGGVQVTMGGWAAPLLEAGPNRIRAIVPFDVASPGQTGTTPLDVQVFSSTTAVGGYTTTLAALAPAVFTVDGRPDGQVLMVNEDGTVNSEENPAAAGSVVMIYATGLGQTMPPLTTGSVATGAASAVSAADLNVWMVGQGGNGILLYAGAAPGLAAGVTQINFQLPGKGVPSGVVAIQLQYGKLDSLPESQLGTYFYTK